MNLFLHWLGSDGRHLLFTSEGAQTLCSPSQVDCMPTANNLVQIGVDVMLLHFPGTLNLACETSYIGKTEEEKLECLLLFSDFSLSSVVH